MSEALVRSICAEYDVEIIAANEYPKPGQTRALATLEAILGKYGDGHLRLVLSTLNETKGNHGLLIAPILWATSDLIVACADWVEKDPSDWFRAWDKIPLGWIIWHSQALYGVVTQRQATAGAMYMMLVHYSEGRKANKDVSFGFIRRLQDMEEAPSLRRVNTARAMSVGKQLVEAKAALPHGEFMGWLEREAGLKYHTANRYMQKARLNEGEAKSKAA